MVKIAITGAAGRMGKALVAAVTQNNSAKLAGALEKEGHAAVGKDSGEAAGIEATGVKITDSPEKAFKDADIIIDFSAPEPTLRHLEIVSSLKKGIVIGTTGFSRHHKEKIGEAAAATRIVLSPNMSIGVNVLFKLVADSARVLGLDYDIEIVESHHRHKVDAPSGTAMRLAEVAAEALKRNLEEVAVYGRKGIIGERKPEEIGIQTVRGGDIVGDHTVMFAGTGERIELIHRAHTRSTFASGAVRAAIWLNNKANGLYDMQDVLGLK
ncbi:MAG: 4-hydroxy-tetrahydrodipicolinate reductase [Deltaproteobacteria bacterium]|nr:4-hydroxy-tetrahydrodipicolinate reductase [Deltaproteobacteria bacterium]